MAPAFQPKTADEKAVYMLYQVLIKAWNDRWCLAAVKDAFEQVQCAPCGTSVVWTA